MATITSNPTVPRRRQTPLLRGVVRTPYYVLTGGLAILFLFPLVWTTVASVSPRAGTAQSEGFGFANYVTLANYQAGIWTYLYNSAFVSLLTVVLTLLISGLGGYAFARFSFPGKNVLFMVTLAILMVPYATLLIPLYVLLTRVGPAELAGGGRARADHVPAARSRSS